MALRTGKGVVRKRVGNTLNIHKPLFNAHFLPPTDLFDILSLLIHIGYQRCQSFQPDQKSEKYWAKGGPQGSELLEWREDPNWPSRSCSLK